MVIFRDAPIATFLLEFQIFVLQAACTMCRYFFFFYRIFFPLPIIDFPLYPLYYYAYVYGSVIRLTVYR